MLVFCGFGCATHFMESCLRFLARQRKMPGFPPHIIGPPHNWGGKPSGTKTVEKTKIEQVLVRKACPGMAHEEKRDFSHPRADAFAGANAEEKVGLLRSK